MCSSDLCVCVCERERERMRVYIKIFFLHPCIPALHDCLSGFEALKTFVLVSTIMTWARSKPVDPVRPCSTPWGGGREGERLFSCADFLYPLLQDEPDIPFTEEDYRRRRCHPNYKDHIALEKLVIKLGKTVSVDVPVGA